MILIRGGDVYTREGIVTADVLIDGSTVAAVGASVTAGGADEIDATGCLVGPGLVDIHVHFREPGQTWKEDISTGSAAAAAGGFTAVVMMPNTDPPVDGVKVVELISKSAGQSQLVDSFASAALTKGRSGVEATDLDALYRTGVRLFTDDGDGVADAGLLKEIMEKITTLPGAFVAQHAEDARLTDGGHMHEGELSRQLGVGGLPSEAETEMVRRDLQLVAETGSRYHCQHVSSRHTVDLIRSAKAAGLNVTAEVTPHHLSFVDSDVASLDTNLKMYPPLRTTADRDALRGALRDGSIDLVATDHAPHTPDEKSVPFADAPRGVIGLETSAAVVNEVLDDHALFFEVMSVSPARLMGMIHHGNPVARGVRANLVVFDPSARWVPSTSLSKSSNTPYRSQMVTGRVLATIHDGVVTHDGRSG